MISSIEPEGSRIAYPLAEDTPMVRKPRHTASKLLIAGLGLASATYAKKDGMDLEKKTLTRCALLHCELPVFRRSARIIAAARKAEIAR